MLRTVYCMVRGQCCLLYFMCCAVSRTSFISYTMHHKASYELCCIPCIYMRTHVLCVVYSQFFVMSYVKEHANQMVYIVYTILCLHDKTTCTDAHIKKKCLYYTNTEHIQIQFMISCKSYMYIYIVMPSTLYQFMLKYIVYSLWYIVLYTLYNVHLTGNRENDVYSGLYTIHNNSVKNHLPYKGPPVYPSQRM